MREFKTYHPLVNFIYFFFVIAFSCFFMHPVFLAISFISAFTYSIMTGGRKALLFNIRVILPLTVLSFVINPMFNHQGVTIITYLPDMNPLTAESVIYGFFSSLMLSCVMLHFSSFNRIITSDKIIYLFAKLSPGLSLIFSMVLRFIGLFTDRFKKVLKIKNAQHEKRGILKRAKDGLDSLSIMITWALEHALITSKSMQSRGYSLPGRSSYSNFTFDNRDKITLFFILSLAIYVIIGIFTPYTGYSYFPRFKPVILSGYSISIFIAYFLLCIMPVMLEIREVLKWKSLKQKI